MIFVDPLLSWSHFSNKNFLKIRLLNSMGMKTNIIQAKFIIIMLIFSSD